MTLDQIQANPLLNSLLAPYLQAGAGLAQTQASTTNTQLAAPGIAAQSQSDIANMAAAKQNADRVNFVNQTQQQFDAAKQQGGYVDPRTYNSTKAKAASLGIEGDNFDKLYQQDYTDPNNITYNTAEGRANQQAYGEIKRQTQGLLDQYNSIPDSQKGPAKSFFEQLGPLGGYLAPQATSYENAAAGLSAQLKGLVGGGQGSGLRVTQTELDRWQSLLPSPRNTEAQNQKNIQILDSELKNTFNTPVGLDSKYLPKSVDTGLPSTLTNNAVGDVLGQISGLPDIVKNAPGNAITSVLPALSPLSDILGLNSAPKEAGGIINQYTNIAQNPVQAFTQHPVNTTLAALAPLGMFMGGFKGENSTSTGETPPTGGGASTSGETATGATQSQNPIGSPPGNVKTALFPNASRDFGFAAKDNAVNYIDNNNIPIPGDSINEAIQAQAENLHMQFSGISKADIDTALQNVESSFKGKNLTADQAQTIYDGIPSGFTPRGIEKEDFNSQLAQIKRQAISSALEKAAPGQGWQQGVQAQAKAYKAEKGQPANIIKNLPQNAVRTGMNLAGFGFLKDFLGL